MPRAGVLEEAQETQMEIAAINMPVWYWPKALGSVLPFWAHQTGNSRVEGSSSGVRADDTLLLPLRQPRQAVSFLQNIRPSLGEVGAPKLLLFFVHTLPTSHNAEDLQLLQAKSQELFLPGIK